MLAPKFKVLKAPFSLPSHFLTQGSSAVHLAATRVVKVTHLLRRSASVDLLLLSRTMTRATRFFGLAAAAVTLWTLFILDILPFPVISREAKHEILPAVSRFA